MCEEKSLEREKKNSQQKSSCDRKKAGDIERLRRVLVEDFVVSPSVITAEFAFFSELKEDVTGGIAGMLHSVSPLQVWNLS